MSPHIGRCFILIFVTLLGCKEAPVGQPDAGPQGQGLEGEWTGVQSVRPGGAGRAAEVWFDQIGDNLVGVLVISDSADAQGLALTGHFVRYGPSTFKRVNSIFPDGGPNESYPLTVTQTSANHLDIIEHNVKFDGGPLPIYYRFDRK
jgi:hypothetical protein